MNIFVRLLWGPLMKWNRNRLLEQYKTYNQVSSPADILLIGDSITEEFRMSELITQKVVNRGISGEATSGLLGELDAVVYELNPKKVFILIGTNDLNFIRYVEDETVSNMEQIILEIKKYCPNTKVHMLAVFPINELVKKPNTGKRTNELINRLNKRYLDIAERQKITFIDITKQLKDEQGKLKKEYTYDGLHITGVGYKVILKELQKYFDEETS